MNAIPPEKRNPAGKFQPDDPIDFTKNNPDHPGWVWLKKWIKRFPFFMFISNTEASLPP